MTVLHPILLDPGEPTSGHVRFGRNVGLEDAASPDENRPWQAITSTT
ncbi:MAG: hypothetical protein ACI8XM_001112 [Haloarculaceae archaeon]|jgi:hypothetical protein